MTCALTAAPTKKMPAVAGTGADGRTKVGWASSSVAVAWLVASLCPASAFPTFPVIGGIRPPEASGRVECGDRGSDGENSSDRRRDGGVVARTSPRTYGVTSPCPVPVFPTFPASPSTPPVPGSSASLSQVEMSLRWFSEDDDDVILYSAEPCRNQAWELPVRVTYTEFEDVLRFMWLSAGSKRVARGRSPCKVEHLPSSRIATSNNYHQIFYIRRSQILLRKHLNYIYRRPGGGRWGICPPAFIKTKHEP